jgi:hypothetical protein
MATTTNYGWTTPDDTALVKDGASAIRTLGSSIDSTLKTQIDAQIPKTIVDAKGDLIAATAADTVSKLSVGTNGQLLSADSTAATGLAWVAAPASGGMTLISNTSLSGGSITISSIPSTYKHLFMVVEGMAMNAANNLQMRFNGVTTNTYARSFATVNGGDVSWSGGASGTSTSMDLIQAGSSATQPTGLISTIPLYASSINRKSCYGQGFRPSTTTSIHMGFLETTSAISSLTLIASGTTFTAGSVYLYGVS